LRQSRTDLMQSFNLSRQLLWSYVVIVLFLLSQDSVDAFPDMDNFYGGDGGPTIRSLMEVRVCFDAAFSSAYFDVVFHSIILCLIHFSLKFSPTEVTCYYLHACRSWPGRVR